ncbi:MAG: hypothetical protein GXP06_04460 [Alphaproteobacteria bacterium]|nr:hypothetical protein [Alphaproteobacteria bacterium]
MKNRPNTQCSRFAALLLVSTVAMAGASHAEDMTPLPQALEIELALSALPEHLQDEAAIYVLNPSRGYEIHRQGSNGFATFVARASTRFVAADWDYDYPADQLIPLAFDNVGVSEHMQTYFDIAQMRATGVAPAKAKARLRASFEDGTYKAPDKGGISYMLAPIHRAYMAAETSGALMTVSMPHLMPYAPYISGGQIGNDNPMNGLPYALNHGGEDTGPHGYMVIMTPTPQADRLREKYAALMAQLCTLNTNWCVADE